MPLSRHRSTDPKAEAYPVAVSKAAICAASIDLLKQAFTDEFQATEEDMRGWAADVQDEYSDHKVSMLAKAKLLMDTVEKAATDRPQQVSQLDKMKALVIGMYLHSANKLKDIPSTVAITGPQIKQVCENVLKDAEYFADTAGDAIYTNIKLKANWHNDNVPETRAGKQSKTRQIAIIKGGNPVKNAEGKDTPTKEVDVEGTKANLKEWYARLTDSASSNAKEWSDNLAKELKNLKINL